MWFEERLYLRFGGNTIAQLALLLPSDENLAVDECRNSPLAIEQPSADPPLTSSPSPTSPTPYQSS